MNKDKQKKTFGEIMKKYSTPFSAIFIGIITTSTFAIVSTMYGWFIMKSMNVLNEGYADRASA